MKALILVALIASMTNYSYAAKSTKKVMQSTMDSFVKLFPYMNNEMKFKDPQNEKFIKGYLTQIVANFKTAKHISDFKKPGLAPNYETISNHLEDTLMSFKSGSKDFARIKLSTSLNLCMSCHTQIPKDQLSGYIFSKHKINQKTFENPYEYANFLFILRKYKQAQSTFEKTITWRKTKQKELKKIQKILGSSDGHYDKILMNSLRKILVIHTKVNRSPAKAIKYFSKMLKKKGLPVYAKNEIKEWITHLKIWKKDPLMKLDLTTEDSVKKVLSREESRLEISDHAVGSGDFDIDLLMTSGIASNFMMYAPETKIAPQILYMLGIAENRLNKNIFFTIGDLYLKNCIKDYPKSSYARKCLNEYENEVKIRFTGSLGTDIPSDKKRELKQLKSLLK